MLTVGGLGLQVNTIDAVEHIEVVHINRTRIGLHRREDVGHRHSGELHLVAIHIEIELWYLSLKRRREAFDFLILRSIVHQRVGGAHQILEGSLATCLQLQLETARRSQTGNNRRSGQVNLTFGVFVYLATHGFHHLVDGGIVALVPRFQNNGQLAACLAGTHTRAGTGDILYILHGRLLHQKVDGTVGHFASALQRGTLGHFQLDCEISLVLNGQEAGGCKAMQNEDAQQSQTEVHGDATRMLHGATYQLDVFRITDGKPLVDESEHAVLRFVGILGTQNERTHHRAQRESHHRGQQYRHHNGHRKLAVELARNARQEAHRHEHGRQHERRGDDGTHQSVHSLLRGFIRAEVFFFHNTLHVLHYHDGIVHHNTDGQYKAEQGQHVEREAEDEHEAESTDKGDRHRHHRDDGSTPALQRQINHDDNQYQCFEQRLVHLVNRFVDVGRHVERYLILQTLGEVGADFLHRLLDVLGHFHGIGSGQHVNAQHGSVTVIDTTLGVIGLRFERNAGHVAHPNQRTVGIGTEHDLLKLCRRRQTSLRGDGDGNVEPIDRLLTQDTGRRLAVLVLQGILHVFHRQSVVGQTSGIHPYLHGVVAASDVGHTAHTRDASQKVHHIQRGKVTQIDFIELGVVRRQADGHQLAGRLLVHLDAVLHHFGRQARLGQLDAVLYFDGSQVGVGRNVEGDGGREASRVGAGRLHVEHARRTVEFLLDGGGHGLRHGDGTGARIGSRDFHHRRRYLRILVDGEHHQADDTHNDNQYGDDGREYRSVYKEINFHKRDRFLMLEL